MTDKIQTFDFPMIGRFMLGIFIFLHTFGFNTEHSKLLQQIYSI